MQLKLIALLEFGLHENKTAVIYELLIQRCDKSVIIDMVDCWKLIKTNGLALGVVSLYNRSILGKKWNWKLD